MEQSGSYKRPPARGARTDRHGKKNWEHKRSADGRRRQRSDDSPEAAARTQFNKEISENLQQSMAENNRAIREFKRNKILCARCGKEIENIAEALCDRQTGEPLHFDCVLALLHEQEPLNPGERIVYIGHGRFAVTSQSVMQGGPRSGPHSGLHGGLRDKSFTINRVIEWENETVPQAEWRKEISTLFSQVK